MSPRRAVALTPGISGQCDEQLPLFNLGQLVKPCRQFVGQTHRLLSTPPRPRHLPGGNTHLRIVHTDNYTANMLRVTYTRHNNLPLERRKLSVWRCIANRQQTTNPRRPNYSGSTPTTGHRHRTRQPGPRRTSGGAQPAKHEPPSIPAGWVTPRNNYATSTRPGTNSCNAGRSSRWARSRSSTT
jgi:hypothetical protein